MEGGNVMVKLDIKAFGLSLGIVWGAGMFLLGLTVMFCNWGGAWVALMSSIYIGYKATFWGSIIGGIWGFFDAGIGGAIIAWLYNKGSRLDERFFSQGF
jgi:hypothetical protein